MSEWTEITDHDDISYDFENIDILYKSDESGNHYITFPLVLLVEAVKNKIWKEAQELPLSGHERVEWVHRTFKSAFSQ